jgi:anti-anti-sigma regulatory factor
MLTTKRTVSIHPFPGQISATTKNDLLRRMEMYYENGHPRFVIDCSRMENVGREELDLLLCCLEEAMKFKGDVRLAQVQPSANAILQKSGAGRLFEIFDTSDSAVASYHNRAVGTWMPALQSSELENKTAA